MPSAITLTVSHLPTSTSFFLSALQPLNYEYRGATDNNSTIAFGSSLSPDAPPDFWITQEIPGVPAGAAHVAFPAPTHTQVQQFFSAAIKAGARIHGEPAPRDASGYYSAAVIDFDGNSIEAVYRPSYSENKENNLPSVVPPQAKDDTKSAVISVRSKNPQPPASGDVLDKLVSEARTAAQLARDVVNNVRAPAQNAEETKHDGIVGTLLGVAAGAALTYVFTGNRDKNGSPNIDRDIDFERPAIPGRSYTVPTTPSELSRSSSRQRVIEAPPRSYTQRTNRYHAEPRKRAVTVEEVERVYVKPARSRNRRSSMSALNVDSGNRIRMIDAAPVADSRASRSRSSRDKPAYEVEYPSSKASRKSSKTTRPHEKEAKYNRAYPPSAFSKVSAKVSEIAERVALPASRTNTYAGSEASTIKPARSHPKSKSKSKSRHHSRERSRDRRPDEYPLPPSRAGTWPGGASIDGRSRSRKPSRRDETVTVIGAGVPDQELTPDDSISQISSVAPSKVRRR